MRQYGGPVSRAEASAPSLEALSIHPFEYGSFFRTASTSFGEEAKTTTIEAE